MPASLRLSAILTAALLLGACAAPRPWFEPLGPETLQRDTPVRQLVTLDFQGRTRALQTVLTRDRGGLTLVGLSSVGQRLFTMTWDGRQAELRSGVAQLDRLDPRWMLTDIQLAFWPLEDLRGALPAGVSLEQVGTQRALWRGGELLWMRATTQADPWRGETRIYNAELGYRLTVRPLDMAGAGR